MICGNTVLVTSSIFPYLKILWGLPPRLGPRHPPSKSGADGIGIAYAFADTMYKYQSFMKDLM